MRYLREIPLRYTDTTSAPADLARTAAGFGGAALTCIEHVLLEPADASPVAEAHALECIAAEARAAGHFGLLALERTPSTDDPDPSTVDVLIENHGSVFLFRGRTDAGLTWLKENVESESWQWFGYNALAVEPRYAGALVCTIEHAGLAVR
jgi:hypothetical protein